MDWRFLDFKPGHPTLPRIDLIIDYIDLHGTYGSKLIHGIPDTVPMSPVVEPANYLAWVPMYEVRMLPASTTIITSRDIKLVR